MPSGRAGRESLARAGRRARRSADTTPSGPSNAPPSGTESRWLPVTTPGRRVRVAPPRPLVAGAVLGHVQAARRASPANHSRRVRSSPSRRTGGSRPSPARPTGAGPPTCRAKVTRQPSRIGHAHAALASRPRRPARSRRRRAGGRPCPGRWSAPARASARPASVPSATVTCPAWIERPMPTPPPWWIDTQVAPDDACRPAR